MEEPLLISLNDLKWTPEGYCVLSVPGAPHTYLAQAGLVTEALRFFKAHPLADYFDSGVFEAETAKAVCPNPFPERTRSRVTHR